MFQPDDDRFRNWEKTLTQSEDGAVKCQRVQPIPTRLPLNRGHHSPRSPACPHPVHSYPLTVSAAFCTLELCISCGRTHFVGQLRPYGKLFKKCLSPRVDLRFILDWLWLEQITSEMIFLSSYLRLATEPPRRTSLLRSPLSFPRSEPRFYRSKSFLKVNIYDTQDTLRSV